MLNLRFMICICAACLAVGVRAQPVPPHPPSGEARERVQGEILENLGDRLSFGTPDDARASIEVLRALAAESWDQPDARYVMLGLALEKAIDLADARLAAAMIDELRVGHAINPLQMP